MLGWTYKCKNWATDPNDYVYVILQRDAKSFEKACKALGFEDWLTNPDFNTAATNTNRRYTNVSNHSPSPRINMR